MTPLRNRLLEARKRLGLPWDVLERDYLLSWILASIARVESLRDTLIFRNQPEAHGQFHLSQSPN